MLGTMVVDDPLNAVASHLERLPHTGLRRAAVLLPAERHAHSLRRLVCVERQQPELLAGVALLSPLDLARELLTRAGHVCRDGFEAVRRLRLLRAFDAPDIADRLRYFRAEQLRGGRGYAAAFAHTIADLEAAGVDAAAALALGDALAAVDEDTAHRLHDVGVLWQYANGNAPRRQSTAEILLQAADRLRTQPELATDLPCMALLTGAPSTALLRFLEALPYRELILHEARPLRTGTQRWRQSELFASAAPAIEDASPTDGGADELSLVRRYVFALPEVLTDPNRPRSAGADGSVTVEEHASVEEEIEAAALWVGERLRDGVVAEQIALVVPELEPYARLLVERLMRMAGDVAGSLPVHVAGGMSLASSPAGLRLGGLLRAIARGLDAASTIRILPWLRHPNEGAAPVPSRLSASKAARLVYDCGIVGGTATDPATIGEWVPRLTQRLAALQGVSAAAVATEGERNRMLGRQQAARVAKDIEHVLPAIADLQELTLRAAAGAPLAELWPDVLAFARRWLRLPPDPPELLALLAEATSAMVDDPEASQLGGLSAIGLLADALHQSRRSTIRFGEPGVFIGTAAHTAGLRFAAVRVLGLAEGVTPHTAHDDPILPDASRQLVERAAREQAPDVVIPRLADRVLDEIHDVFRVLQGTTAQLSLSVPRQSVERGEREVSGILLEVAAALGRAAPGETPRGDVPTAARLRSAYFHARRHGEGSPTRARPLTPRARLTTLTHIDPTGCRVPAGWMLPGALSLTAPSQDDSASLEGDVASTLRTTQIPGLTRQRPLSASGVKVLLECPHRFLLERILFLKEPPRRPPTDAVDPIVYGNLFHDAADRFLRQHGAALCKHDRTEAEWITIARAIAGECFDAQLRDLPLRGATTIARERQRLLAQIEALVRHEWSAPSRNFYASEFGFGDPDPVELTLDSGHLYLRGAIDRVDTVGPHALQVRDLKTGRVLDFVEEPVHPSRDVQIGTYVLILETLRPDDHGEVSLAAYVHPSAAQEPDRRFEGIELDALRRATRAWLSLAHDLLRDGLFPRTPDVRDCALCPFVPACGEGAQARSAAHLEQADEGSPLGRFLRLKKQRANHD